MVEKGLLRLKPTLVYHCAAHTAVGAAEEGKELDFAINVTGTSQSPEKYGSTLSISRQAGVFDGRKPVGQEWGSR